MKKISGTGTTRWTTGWALTTAALCVLASGVRPATAKAPENRVICRVELDHDILPANEEQTAVVKVSLDAPKHERRERPPVNLAIVLDRSGSMSGEKLDKARQAAMDAVRRLGSQDMFSLVVYDHNVETLVPAQSAANIEWIEGRIRQIQAGGNTALFGGVSQGASEVRKNMGSRFVHRIILLSDGLANVGPSTAEELGRLGAALMKEGIAVSTIGVGTDYNEDLMTRLAQNSDGNSYFVESSRDLPRIFGAELGDVLSIVAKKVNLKIVFDGGVTPLSIIGREGRIRGNAVEISLNQLYGGQEKYALVKVQVPAGKSGEERPLALASVSYENAVTLAIEESTVGAAARFSENSREVRESANARVRRDVLINLNAEAQEAAVQLADQGKDKAAIQQLRNSAEQLESGAEELGDAKLGQKALDMRQQAQQIEQEGMNSKLRKGMRTDSYQAKNQQVAQ